MKTLVKIAICTIALSGCADDPGPHTHWKKVDLNTNTHFQKVFFVNSNVGFVGGDQNAALSTTVNVGNYIDYAEEVHINTEPAPDYNITVSTDDPQPTLFKTTDGGDSWEKLTPPFVSTIRDIFFVNEQVGYVATANEGVHKTTDGGKTWKSVLSNIAFLGDQVILTHPYEKLYFLNEMEGFAFKKYQSFMVKTVDRGLSWTMVPSFHPASNDSGLEYMVFPSDDFTGYAIRGRSLLKTVDGGSTWETLQFTASPAFDDAVIDDLSFLNENVAFMIYGGAPYISTDGANHWDRVDFSPLSLIGDRVQAINENEFYLLYHGNPRVARANISNREYVSMAPGDDKTVINDWFFTESKGFAVGLNGLVLRYEHE
ncbi:MAG TPA: YCF48-related protein [Chryseosolibacter sp.]|nr:YCF48-related protein [Chryseosolibacter sp.]